MSQQWQSSSWTSGDVHFYLCWLNFWQQSPIDRLCGSYNHTTHTHTHTLTHSVRLCVGCSVLWSLFTAEQLVEWISLHLLSSLTRTRTHTHTHTHKPSSSFYTLIIINVAVIITHPHRHHHVMVCVWRQMFVSVCECVCVFYRHLYTLPLCLHQTLYHLTQQ